MTTTALVTGVGGPAGISVIRSLLARGDKVIAADADRLASGLYLVPAQHRVLVSSRGSDEVFSIEPKSMTWKLWHSGYRMELIRVAGDRLVAASLDDGVLIGPEATVEAKN